MCGGVACAENETCCLATGKCFDPAGDAGACVAPPADDDSVGRRTCASNADCSAIEFCRPDNAELCQGSGHCVPIGNCGSCSGAECAVCACDGNSYPDVQTACLSRAAVPSRRGACGVPTTVGGGGAGGAATTITPCGTDADCTGDELCCPITALCYPQSEPGRCQRPPAGTSFPCTANEQCEPEQYCVGDGCSGPGGCKERSSDDCGVTLEPVCGCDGVTYTSAACAQARGVRVAADGNCGEK
jgi:hypothetical protein